MMDRKTAELIANKIFECGNVPDSPCTRIQFMGGEWPDNEKNQGGACKIALIDFLEEIDINTP